MQSYCRYSRKLCKYSFAKSQKQQQARTAAWSSFLLPKDDNPRGSVRRRRQQVADAEAEVVIDNNPHASCCGLGGSITTTSHMGIKRIKKKNPPQWGRLPPIPANWQEFPNDAPERGLYSPRAMATRRIIRIALSRVMEPPTLHFMAAAACATLGIGAVEATLLCQQWPFFESVDAGRFVLQYAAHNLFPSVVWETQDARLVCTAMGLDPIELLRDLEGKTPASAWLLLQTQWLSTSRFFFAGFMMIAQLFRAATISMESFDEYEQRIRSGREPPLSIQNGLIVRLCGRDSHAAEVSLQRMGTHLFPVFEHPERVKFLVRKHSLKRQRPVFWCVPPGLYWRSYSWEKFPVESACFLKAQNNPQDKILVLEADATNGNDPLTIGDTALDLTLEDASQGFRRILQRYRQEGFEMGRDFRALRVYLGNSMEVTKTGGGHAYTVRHRVRYAKEMDVLIDSRAPVLRKILEWCETAASKDRKLFFQTSSREYFLNLQKLLKEYGYEIYDPLDLRMLHKLRETMKDEEVNSDATRAAAATTTTSAQSILNVLLDDFVPQDLEHHGDFLNQPLIPSANGKVDENEKDAATNKMASKDMLRKVARMVKLPRLVHLETTAETVNAVEALITAGEVDASNCCALIDRQEVVAVLEATLQSRSGFVQSTKYQWERKTSRDSEPETSGIAQGGDSSDTIQVRHSSGLQIICSSSIHDEVLRQVRYWARLGYQAAEIQKEFDAQYQEILQQSHTVQKQVTGSTKKEGSGDQSTVREEKENTSVPSQSREE